MNKKYAEFYNVMLADGPTKVSNPGAPSNGLLAITNEERKVQDPVY
jgi:hypothetical protein